MLCPPAKHGGFVCPPPSYRSKAFWSDPALGPRAEVKFPSMVFATRVREKIERTSPRSPLEGLSNVPLIMTHAPKLSWSHLTSPRWFVSVDHNAEIVVGLPLREAARNCPFRASPPSWYFSISGGKAGFSFFSFSAPSCPKGPGLLGKTTRSYVLQIEWTQHLLVATREPTELHLREKTGASSASNRIVEILQAGPRAANRQKCSPKPEEPRFPLSRGRARSEYFRCLEISPLSDDCPEH